MGTLEDLKTRTDGWDGYEAPAPDPRALEAAQSWAERVGGNRWRDAHVSSDEEGEVSFEWWRGDRKVSAFVGPESVEYIKVSRPGGNLKMTDGEINDAEGWRELWRWLDGDA